MRPIFIAGLIMLFSIVGNGQTSGIKEIDDALDQMNRGNNRNAANLFIKALRQYPQNFAANYNLGLALSHLGKPDSAFLYYNIAAGIEPGNPMVYVNRGVMYYQLKDTANGDADEKKVTKLKPLFPDAFGNLGYTLSARKKYNQAILYFDSAIAVNKYFFQAYINKAGTFSDMGMHEEAIDVLNTVIALKPAKLADAYANRANEYYELGDLMHALEDCDKSISLYSKDPQSYILRSKVKDLLGDDNGAVDDCTMAINIDSTVAEFYNQRAVRRFDLKDYEGIIKDCNKAIALDPNHYQAYTQRGDAYDELNKFEEAQRDYNKAIALQPSTFIAYREVAASAIHQASVSTNDYKKALQCIDKALTLEPTDIFLLKNKFSLQWLLKNYKAVFVTLDQCIQFNKDSAATVGSLYMIKAAFYDTLHDNENACKNAFEALKKGYGEGYEFLLSHKCETYKQNPYVKAIPFIMKAEEKHAARNYYAEIEALDEEIKLLPDSAMAYYNRGIAKRRLNRFDEAIADYDKSISLNPKFPDAIVSRGISKTFLNDIEGAIKDYELAIKVDSTFSMAYYDYANLLEDTNVEIAIELFTKAIRFNKNYAKAYLSRGELYIRVSKKEEACRDFNKAYALGMVEGKGKSLLYCK